MTVDSPERYCDATPAAVKETIGELAGDDGVREGDVFRAFPACNVETVAETIDRLKQRGEVYAVGGRYRVTNQPL